jgi:hypothetical protein
MELYTEQPSQAEIDSMRSFLSFPLTGDRILDGKMAIREIRERFRTTKDRCRARILASACKIAREDIIWFYLLYCKKGQ